MSKNAGSAKAAENKSSARKETAKKNKKTGEPSLNIEELREIAELVDEHGFTDFEFENANIHLRLSKNPPPQQFYQAMQPLTGISAAPATGSPVASGGGEQSVTVPASPPSAGTDVEVEQAEPDQNLHKITSPIVGTFYRSPAPDKDPYVKEGSIVSPDSIVCIVEAMKLMNEIEAEVSGEVVKIYVENGQPVEFGQPLFGIRK